MAQKSPFQGLCTLWISGGAVTQLSPFGLPSLESVLYEDYQRYGLKPTDPGFKYLGRLFSDLVIRPIFTENLERANLLETATDLFIEDQGYRLSTSLVFTADSIVSSIFDLPASVQSTPFFSQRGGRVQTLDYSLLVIQANDDSPFGDEIGLRGLVRCFYYPRVKVLPAERVIGTGPEIKQVEFLVLNNFNPVAGQQLVSEWTTSRQDPTQFYNDDATPVILNPNIFNGSSPGPNPE